MKVFVIIIIVCLIGFLVAWRLVYLASKFDELIEEQYKKYFKELKNKDK